MVLHPPGSWWLRLAWRGHKCSGGSLFLWRGGGAGSDTAPLQPALLLLVCSPCRDTRHSRLKHQTSRNKWHQMSAVLPLLSHVLEVIFTEVTTALCWTLWAVYIQTCTLVKLFLSHGKLTWLEVLTLASACILPHYPEDAHLKKTGLFLKACKHRESMNHLCWFLQKQ